MELLKRLNEEGSTVQVTEENAVDRGRIIELRDGFILNESRSVESRTT